MASNTQQSGWKGCTYHVEKNVRRCTTTQTDISIAYRRYDVSTPQGTVLLIPGYNCTCDALHQSFVEGISCDNRFTVIVVDNRDAGLSTGHPSLGSPPMWKFFLPLWCVGSVAPMYRLEDMADDHAALLHSLGLTKQPIHVLGFSMGGMIAQHMALRHPKLVASVTSAVSSTSARDLPGPPFRTQLGFTWRPKDDSIEAKVECKMAWNAAFGIGNPDDLEQPDVAAYVKAVSERDVLRRLESKHGTHPRQLTAIVHAPCRDRPLRDCHVPMLVLVGMKDALVPVQHGFRTAACAAEASLVAIEDLGHIVDPNTQPQVLSAFSKFLFGASTIS